MDINIHLDLILVLIHFAQRILIYLVVLVCISSIYLFTNTDYFVQTYCLCNGWDRDGTRRNPYNHSQSLPENLSQGLPEHIW